jgi:Kinesin motor domain
VCDAGSERQKEADTSGDRLQEAKKINGSLSSLGRVIKALTEQGAGSSHVPYRDSKLTHLLKVWSLAVDCRASLHIQDARAMIIKQNVWRLLHLELIQVSLLGMQDSIGGNCKAVIIANVSAADEHASQTAHTLAFAKRAKNIVNKASPAASSCQSGSMTVNAFLTTAVQVCCTV